MWTLAAARVAVADCWLRRWSAPPATTSCSGRQAACQHAQWWSFVCTAKQHLHSTHSGDITCAIARQHTPRALRDDDTGRASAGLLLLLFLLSCWLIVVVVLVCMLKAAAIVVVGESAIGEWRGKQQNCGGSVCVVLLVRCCVRSRTGWCRCVVCRCKGVFRPGLMLVQHTIT